ncbi:MAG TPA: NUDIX hydrolase, partial [Clostridiaceae bacterium]|nr:NUDIX hydrolase [Clostridiaceae bacterium]
MKSGKTQMAESAVTLHEETLTRTPTYRGRLFTTETLSVRLHDDSLSTREIIRHPGGAAVVALTDDDRVILVSQYRIAVGAVLLEIPAGKLEPDEDPLGCAQRELAEET